MRRNSLRLSTFSYIGKHLYFLTYCTFQRSRVFTDAETVATTHSQILRAAVDERMNISAYCYMPDHLHLIAAGGSEDSNGKVFISKSKQFSGYEFRRKTGRQLWQRYAYDRLVTPSTLPSVVRYVLGNPVAAGLVEEPFDYPFSGSEVWDRPALEVLMRGYVRPTGGRQPAPRANAGGGLNRPQGAG